MQVLGRPQPWMGLGPEFANPFPEPSKQAIHQTRACSEKRCEMKTPSFQSIHFISP
jgi:hypothetical protein